MMIKKTNYFSPLLLVLIVAISGCMKKDLVEEYDHKKIDSERKVKEISLFINSGKTYNLLSPTAVNWKKADHKISRRASKRKAEKVATLKQTIVDINSYLDGLYPRFSIDKVGYPFWDASEIAMLKDGGYSVFTPVFKKGVTQINALFIFTKTKDGTIAFDLATRKEMIASYDQELNEPNFVLKARLYQFYDQLLFDNKSQFYEDWIKVEFDNIDCAKSVVYNSSQEKLAFLSRQEFYYYTDECFATLNAAEIFDLPEEKKWVRTHYHIVKGIDRFLERSNSEIKKELAQLSIYVGMFEIFDSASQQEHTIRGTEEDSSLEQLNWWLAHPELIIRMNPEAYLKDVIREKK